MIMVTERPKTYLKESVLTKIQAKTPGVSARRAQTEPGTLSVFPDKKMEGDQVVEHEGSVLLLIDGALSARLTGTTIDCVGSPPGIASRDHPSHSNLGIDRGATGLLAGARRECGPARGCPTRP